MDGATVEHRPDDCRVCPLLLVFSAWRPRLCAGRLLQRHGRLRRAPPSLPTTRSTNRPMSASAAGTEYAIALQIANVAVGGPTAPISCVSTVRPLHGGTRALRLRFRRHSRLCAHRRGTITVCDNITATTPTFATLPITGVPAALRLWKSSTASLMSAMRTASCGRAKSTARP
jgi:hypothetical protein